MPDKKLIKHLVYKLVELSQLPRAAAILGEAGFHILCYHGICEEGSDLPKFRPKIFLTRPEFEKRMEWLRKNDFKILDLGQALELSRSGRLTKNSVVVTFDEGFRNFHQLALPILERLEIPVTVYVTTYHVEKMTPIFRLSMQYITWKYGPQFRQIDSEHPEYRNFCSQAVGLSAEWKAIKFGEMALTESQRFDLVRLLLRHVSSQGDAELHPFFLMDHAALADSARRGVRLELHTHRHKPTVAPDKLEREVADNRNSIRIASGHLAHHLAYPSGIWSRNLIPHLPGIGLESAATCIPGLNGRRTSPFALRRFVDSSDIADWEFQAEMSNISTLVRRLAGRHKDESGHVADDNDIPRDLQT